MSTRARVTISLIVIPALAGCIIALLADAFLVTRWLLVMEPVIWIVLCSAALHLIVSQRGGHGVALLVGWLLFAATIRFPVGPQRPGVDSALVTARCTEDLPAPRGPVRVVSACWSEDPSIAAELRKLSPDLMVLDGVGAEDAAQLAEELDMQVSSHRPDTALFVRGSLIPCAGETLSDLPGAFSAVAAMSDGTEVPIIALAQARSQDAASISAGALALASPYTLVAGGVRTHGTFRRTEALLSGARLTSVPQRATWPAQLGPFPTLPLYHSDRIWVGPGWATQAIRTTRIPGSSRLALSAVLTPKSSTSSVPKN